MITLKQAYEGADQREKKYLSAIRNNPKHNILRIASTLRSDNYSKFLYYLFEKKDINSAKQSLYIGQKLFEFINKWDDKKSFPININGFPFLFADSQELIDNICATNIYSLSNIGNRINYGHTLGFAIQNILRNESDKALEFLKIFDDKHKKYPLKEQDSAMLKAIIHGNKKEVEELLEFFLRPENHKKCNDSLSLDFKLFSFHAIVFAKLAWIKGIQVKVDHPLLPMELLPVKPNKEYFIEYDFLKPDYKPIINKKQEVPKPNVKYRKDKPKNKIGVTKDLIKGLIVQNWEATYTDKELQEYVDIIYNAFINPQEADTRYYDFAKLGNLHISHSNKQFTFIEEKPFTNMWTGLKNETDYFFDLVNSSLDIIGAKLVDDEQYLKVKTQLETNAKNNKGFLGKLFK